MSSVLPLIILFMYVKSLIPIPLYFPRYGPGQVSIMKNGYGEITLVNIQDRIIVLVHCPFPYCYLSINQVSLQSLLYFPDRKTFSIKKWLRGDIYVNIQGRRMVLGFCPSPHCNLSIYQVLFKCHQ